MTILDEKIISDAGLSIEQAKIYTYLLNNGMSNAKTISIKTYIGRALVYKVLDQLIKIGLVEKRDNIGKISMFFPTNPSILKSYIEQNKQKIDTSAEIFYKQFGLLLSKFNSLSGKPNIRFLEGLEGLKEMYDDILIEGKDIKLIRPLSDHKNHQITEVLKNHMKKQVEMGIKVKLISPKRDGSIIEEMMEKDKLRYVTRKTLSNDFLIPSQIIIYGDKISITDFNKELIITIIENPSIRETFEKIFDFMFENINETY